MKRAILKPLTYKIRAPFLFPQGWVWHTWVENSSAGNKHAALNAKRRELGAIGVDFGQADYAEFGRASW